MGLKFLVICWGSLFIQIFFLPSPPMEIPFTHILGHLKLSHSSQILCYWFFFFFPWCFVLGSSYCFAFMLTELWLYSIISVLSSLVLILSCVFFLLRHGSFSSLNSDIHLNIVSRYKVVLYVCMYVCMYTYAALSLQMVDGKNVHSSSPGRTPKLQLAAEQPLTGGC